MLFPGEAKMHQNIVFARQANNAGGPFYAKGYGERGKRADGCIGKGDGARTGLPIPRTCQWSARLFLTQTHPSRSY